MIDSSNLLLKNDMERALADTAKNLGEKNAELRAEIERLREALRIIAGLEQCADNRMGNADIAREALRLNQQTEKTK